LSNYEEGEDVDSKTVVSALGDIVSENARTVQFEAIEHLSTTPLLTTRQDDGTVALLLTQLQQFSLTKVEKLQIANLLPTRVVELYVIIEESEDRFSMDDMQAMLEIVRTSIISSASPTTPHDGENSTNSMFIDADGEDDIIAGDDGWEAPHDLDELMDGPRYGEFEDDLGGDVIDEDD